MLVVQSDDFNDSSIRTTVVLAITSNLRLAEAPGNVLLKSEASGLPRDSVVNVSQVLTMDKSRIDNYVASLPVSLLARVEEGLGLVLGP